MCAWTGEQAIGQRTNIQAASPHDEWLSASRLNSLYTTPGQPGKTCGVESFIRVEDVDQVVWNGLALEFAQPLVEQGVRPNDVLRVSTVATHG